MLGMGFLGQQKAGFLWKQGEVKYVSIGMQ